MSVSSLREVGDRFYILVLVIVFEFCRCMGLYSRVENCAEDMTGANHVLIKTSYIKIGGKIIKVPMIQNIISIFHLLYPQPKLQPSGTTIKSNIRK